MRAQSFISAHATRRIAFLLGLTLAIFFTQQAFAQESNPREFSRYEIFAGYLAAGQSGYSDLGFGHGATLSSSFSSIHGAAASFLYNFNRRLGMKGDFSLQPHSEGFVANVCPQVPCSPVTQSATINPRLWNFLGGPEARWRNRSRFSPYAHGLIGIAHASATLSSSGPAVNFAVKTSETGFAAAMGGGADIRFSRRLSFRTGMDFNPAWVGRDDAGDKVALKNVRLWGGILFH